MLPEDPVLVAALQKGDEKMFEMVFRHFYSSLCNYALTIMGDRDEAEDLVQQSMVQLWEKRNTLTVNTSFKSYLFRSIHNASLNRVRHLKVVREHAEDYQSNFYDTVPPSGESRELKAKIQEAINKLPEQCGHVFRLSRMHNMKYAQIAEHLNISVKTVENHMGKALKMLRLELKEFFILLILFGF